MESLCYSANEESEDAYDVSTSLTDLEECAGITRASVGEWNAALSFVFNL